MNMLLGKPQHLQLNYFFAVANRKFIGQNIVKICKFLSQNFKFSGQKIGCPSDHTSSESIAIFFHNTSSVLSES